MLKKDTILKVFKKYGFYSLNRAPYLYQNEEDTGVYFLWPTKHFGNLERVLFFDDEEQLEEEIYKYWWFLKYKNNYEIDIVLDNYEKLSPKVTYEMNGKPITKEMMKSLTLPLDKEKEEEQIKKKQLIRTASLLIAILREKFKIQNETYFKVTEYQEKLKKLTNTYQKKLNQYNKSKEEIPESYELLVDDYDESDKLADTLYDELLTIDTVLNLQSFLASLFSYLQEIDESDTHLQNVYLFNRYPYEIEDLEKKIQILNDALEKKKGVFKPKQNILDLLKQVDATSACTKMINVNLYVEKEQKRLAELYQKYRTIDITILGDYIINYEKLAIDIPELIPTQTSVPMFKKDEVLTSIKAIYESLSRKEKAACHVASSFLKEGLNILYTLKNHSNIEAVLQELKTTEQLAVFQEEFRYLDYYLNAKVRVKYLSILKINTFETFMASLLETMQVLDQINKCVPKNFVAYTTSYDQEIIPLYLKSLHYLEAQTSHIVLVNQGIPLFYSPVQIIKPLDIVENNELVLREKDTLFVLKDYLQIQEKRDKIKVTNYKKDKIIKRKNYVLVSMMKEKNKCTYFKDTFLPLERINEK